MADAGAGRHDLEVVEGGRAPAQEGVALGVALVLALDVDLEGAGPGEGVDLDRVVDHQIDRGERVDLLRVAAEIEHRLAHGREIDHRRHAGEVLHQDACRPERYFLIRAPLAEPADQRLELLGRDRAAILVAQQVLEQHLQRIGQARDFAERGTGRLEREIVISGAADLELAPDAQAVAARHGAGCGHGGSPRSSAVAAKDGGLYPAGSADKRRLRILRAVNSARVRKICTAVK